MTLIASALVHTNALAQTSVDVQLTVDGCNNNFVCEAVIGENVNSCPNDCSYVPPPTSSRRSGSKLTAPAEITIISTSATDTTIRMMWNSNIPVNGSVTWGSSTDYGEGSLQEVGFTTFHNLALTGLRPDTLYTITIRALDLQGRSVQKTFQVSTSRSVTVVPNVQNFFASEQNNGVVLTWKNPSTQFNFVQIVRSKDFFPSAPYDGKIMYEGSAQSFFDRDVERGVRYFYAIFVKGGEGFSSGRVQDIALKNPDESQWDIGQPITIFGPIYDPAITRALHESTIGDDVKVRQKGIEVSRVNNIFYVENYRDVMVTVDKSQEVTERSELFISYFPSATAVRARNFVFTYDEKQGKFVTHFTVTSADEQTPFILYIRNNKKTIGYIGYFHATRSLTEEVEQRTEPKWYQNDLFVSILLLMILLFIITMFSFFILGKRHKKEDEEDLNWACKISTFSQ